MVSGRRLVYARAMAETHTAPDALPRAPAEARRPSIGLGLSARLLLLTVFFVMLAELLIWAPSISRFRKVSLEEHVAKGHLAALALEATPDYMVDRELEDELLRHAEAYGIVLHRPQRHMLALSQDMPPKVDLTVDLRQGMFPMWIFDAVDTLVQTENRVLRVIGVSPKEPATAVEIIMDEAPLREAMFAYSGRILQLSVIISLITAGLVYVSLHWLLVRPMRRVTAAMTEFRDNPEDDSRVIVPGSRTDEVGIAERELAAMQSDLRTALRQKSRLAALGAAVAKINHDLRNSLATAMLVSDRLADIDDPEVKRVTPRLYDAIDRAVHLCSQTLIYASDARPRLRPSLFHVSELVAEVRAAEAGGQSGTTFELVNDVAFEVDVEADRDQLVRVLGNLVRNARDAGAGRVRVTARREAGRVVMEVTDDGPGLPETARDNLFQPFAGSARKGGTGLGLVIARDIVRAHGGDLSLAATGTDGTTFRLELPDRRGQAAP